MLHGSRDPPEPTTQLLIRSPRRRATPRPPALHNPAGQTRSVGRTIRLPQQGRLVLGTDLNRSELSCLLRSQDFLPESVTAAPTLHNTGHHGDRTPTHG